VEIRGIRVGSVDNGQLPINNGWVGRYQEPRIKDSFLHSNFCHFEMRCRAPIEKSPLSPQYKVSHIRSKWHSEPFTLHLFPLANCSW